MFQFSWIFVLASFLYLQVNSAPTGVTVQPGGAQQLTTYCANYTSEGSSAPCASISGQHVVTQHCQEANLTEALQDFLKTVCTVVNAAANGPDSKKLDVCVSSNMTYVPPTFGQSGSDTVAIPSQGTLAQQQPPSSDNQQEDADDHGNDEDEPTEEEEH